MPKKTGLKSIDDQLNDFKQQAKKKTDDDKKAKDSKIDELTLKAKNIIQSDLGDLFGFNELPEILPAGENIKAIWYGTNAQIEALISIDASVSYTFIETVAGEIVSKTEVSTLNFLSTLKEFITKLKND
jgi:hypothetical protein